MNKQVMGHQEHSQPLYIQDKFALSDLQWEIYGEIVAVDLGFKSNHCGTSRFLSLTFPSNGSDSLFRQPYVWNA